MSKEIYYNEIDYPEDTKEVYGNEVDLQEIAQTAITNIDQLDDGVNFAKVLSTDVKNGHIVMSTISGDLDDIADGTTYARVLATALSAGAVLLAQATGDLDDVSDGSTYAKVLSTDISAGHILLSSVTGDLDDVGDGTTYAKVLATSISAGQILLAQASGDLDDISDGSTYGKVASTNITAGNIVLQVNQDLSTQGIKIITASSGARVEIYPDSNTGIQVIDDGGNDVFKALIGGTDVGDVQIGNYAGGQGILYDKSAATFTFKGVIPVTELPDLPSYTNLVGYWTFDETTGSTAYDSSNNGNNGTITTATYADGIAGTALSFNGISGNCKVLDNAAIQNKFDGGGTIAVWVKPTNSGESSLGRIIVKGGAAPVWALSLKDEAGGLSKLRFSYDFDTTDGNWDTVSAVVANGVWSLITVTYNSSSAANVPTIKVNAGNDESLTAVTSPSGTRITDVGSDIYIGNLSTDDRTFNGLIDEPMFFDTILTDGQTKALKNTPSGMKTALGLAGEANANNTETRTSNDTSNVNSIGASEVQIDAQANFKEVLFTGSQNDGLTETVGGTLDRDLLTTLLIGSGGTTTTLISSDFGNHPGPVLEIDWDNDMEFTINAKKYDASNGLAFFGISSAGIGEDGTLVVRHCGFRITGSTIVATMADGTTQETGSVAGVTTTNWNAYKIVFDAGTNAKFYVDSGSGFVLKSTLSTNVPTGTSELPAIAVASRRNGAGGSNANLLIRNNYTIKTVL